jgi:hypothetical protein
MTTALALKTIDFPALVPNSRQARIIAANVGNEPVREQDLTKVSTPAGGGTVWQIDNLGNVESTDEIVGLLVAEGIRCTLWPKDDPSEMRPVIVSHDGLVGYRVGDDLGDCDPKALEKYRIGDRKYDWTALSTGPEFGWGSGKGGPRSRKVKESRVLAILRTGETWPVLVTVGPGSLGNWLPFRKRLPAFIYECVVGLKLQKVKNDAGQPYSQLVPRLVGVLTEEQGNVAEAIYHKPLTAMFNAPPLGGRVISSEGDGSTEE